MRSGNGQWNEELTSCQTISIQNPSPGQYMNSKRQTLNLHDPSVFCCFIFARYLAHEFSIIERSLYSHRNMTAQARAPTLLLVSKLVLMALSHRFVDTDSDWHYRVPGNLRTDSGNKALLILHKCIWGETQRYKDIELQGHKQEAVAEQPPRSQSKDPQSNNLGISAWNLEVDCGCSHGG